MERGKAGQWLWPTLAAAGAAGYLLLAERLEGFGRWLRALSLSGPAGNAGAWAVVLIFTALPALGLLWRGRERADCLLLLAAGEIFFGLYFLVNPTLLYREIDVGRMWGLAFSGSTAATVLAWAVLRGMKRLSRLPSPGHALAGLLRWTAVIAGWLAAASAGVGLWERCAAAIQGNTGAEPGQLWPTCLTLAVLALAELAPALLGCGLLLRGGGLARAMEADPFGGETVALAEVLSRRCGRVAAVSVLLYAGGDLLQMLLFPLLRTTRFTLSFPAATILLAAALGLLCRYLRRAKAVNDDNQTII